MPASVIILTLSLQELHFDLFQCVLISLFQDLGNHGYRIFYPDPWMNLLLTHLYLNFGLYGPILWIFPMNDSQNFEQVDHEIGLCDLNFGRQM